MVKCVYANHSLSDKFSSKHPYLTENKEYAVLDIKKKYGMPFLLILADNGKRDEFCNTRFIKQVAVLGPMAEIEVLY